MTKQQFRLNRAVKASVLTTLPVGTVVEVSQALPSKGTVSVWAHLGACFHIKFECAVSRLAPV